MKERISRIQHFLDEKHVSAALVTFLPDVRWACGFSGSNGILLVTRSGAHFVSDARYGTQARNEVSGAEIHIPGYDLFGFIFEKDLVSAKDTVLFQPEYVTVADMERLSSLNPNVRWLPENGMFKSWVAVKDAWEVDRIRKAQAITETVFENLLAGIRPGMSEREIAAEITYQHLRNGAEKDSFDPIVASGPNGALPHARPSDRKIESGDLITLDMGCFYQGYASDMTRTVCVGRADEKKRQVYQVVRNAQEQASSAVKGGINSRELDRIARDTIAEAGFGPYFGHGLGHGVGLQIHEWPRASYNTSDTIPAGCVLTIEPGIYLPDQFGIRIEDMLWITDTGSENLTSPTHDLIEL